MIITIIAQFSLLFINLFSDTMNMISINKKITMLMYREDLQFNNEIIELIIKLLNNIKNVTNKDNVFKFTSKKNLIIGEKRY